MLPSKEEISRRKQNRTIKRDIMKELKQQKLEQRLRARLEKGELVQQSADNALDSFFTLLFLCDQGSIVNSIIMECKLHHHGV